jgi:hypothetical protein
VDVYDRCGLVGIPTEDRISINLDMNLIGLHIIIFQQCTSVRT